MYFPFSQCGHNVLLIGKLGGEGTMSSILFLFLLRTMVEMGAYSYFVELNLENFFLIGFDGV